MPSKIPITGGDGTYNAATYQINEDAVNKELGRYVISAADGTPYNASNSFPVNIATGSTITVTVGTVSVGNTPAVTISGTPTIGGTVSVGNVINVLGTVSSQVTISTVSVGNFPASQAVTGTLSVGNTHPVTGSGTFTVLGTVSLGSNPTANLASNSAPIGAVNIRLTGTDVKDDTQFGEGLTTGVMSVHGRVYNGTSYDRWRGQTYTTTDAIYNATVSVTPKFASILATASGNTLLIASVSSKKIRPLSYTVVAGATVSVKFAHGTTDLTGPMYFFPSAGAHTGYTPVGHFETAAGAGLLINLSGNSTVSGHLTYLEI